MKKSINIRNLIITMLCITIIFMGIGFAFLAVKLEEKCSIEESFDIVITKAEAQTSIKGGQTAPTATKELVDDGKTIKFNFTMNNPNDEIAYEITIKNTGTLPAEIIRLVSTPDYISDQKASSSIEPVVITHTKLKNKTLNPEETTTVKLVVKYNMSNNPKQIYIPYQLTVLATSKNK